MSGAAEPNHGLVAIQELIAPSPRASGPWHSCARWLSALCVLEPLVAITWAAAFARVQHRSLTLSQFVLLGIGFWLVYTADHWLDAARSRGRSMLTSRHSFAARHPKELAGAWALVLLGGVTLAAHALTLRQWLGGLMVAALAVLYLLCVHHGRRSRLRLREKGAKEVGVACVFAFGTTLFLWTRAAYPHVLLFVNALFALLVLQNLVTIVELERDIDRNQNCPSLAWRVLALDKPLFLLTALFTATCALLALAARLRAPGEVTFLLYLGLALSSAAIQGVLHLPRLDVESKHLLADVAVLLGALPTLCML